MGFFKKIFKPVSKVLDKIIPNEIKPALPYLAAFAPVFGPTAGMFGSTMGRRALTSGLLNIGGQLAQEGNEGDINLLSAGLGALTGAMTVPGVEGGKAIGVDKFGNEIISRGAPSSAEIFRGGSQKIGTDTLRGKGLEFLAKGSDIFAKGAADPFSTAGLKAATLPATTATGDVMQAEARRLEKQSIIDAALEEATGLADSAASALAIRNAMEAYGFFSEDEILSTIESAGYKAGGRVGFMFGSPNDPKLTEYLMEKMKEKESSKKESPGGLDVLLGSAGAGMEDAEDRPFKFDAQQFMIDKYNEEGVQPEILGSGFQGDDEIFVISTPGGGTMMITQEQYTENFGERKAKGGRVGAEEGGLMNLGGKEMDLRKGGFVPIGKKERADDVPARLSKNEFVMTADAVRAAGGGSVNEGAKRMYDVMNKLEARA